MTIFWKEIWRWYLLWSIWMCSCIWH